jgi:hypothetical protein
MEWRMEAVVVVVVVVMVVVVVGDQDTMFPPAW